jgi:hypothetical protein
MVVVYNNVVVEPKGIPDPEVFALGKPHLMSAPVTILKGLIHLVEEAQALEVVVNDPPTSQEGESSLQSVSTPHTENANTTTDFVGKASSSRERSDLPIVVLGKSVSYFPRGCHANMKVTIGKSSATSAATKLPISREPIVFIVIRSPDVRSAVKLPTTLGKKTKGLKRNSKSNSSFLSFSSSYTDCLFRCKGK